MKHSAIWVSLAVLALFLISGCGSSELDDDVQPLAESMCRFIGVQNNLKAAVDSNDSINIQRYSAEKHKMTIEMTILNKEFQDKYGDLISDQEFGKRFRKSMNRAMIDCPHLAPGDREKMEAELKTSR